MQHRNSSTETTIGVSKLGGGGNYSTNLRQIVLSFEEWEKIRPQYGGKKLHSEWTNILSKKIEVFKPLCVSYHRINLKSNSRDCHFVLAEGRCKFEVCITFKLWIESELEGTNDVIINFLTYGSISNQHNNNKTVFSRHLSGEIRQEVSSTLSKSSPINCYYEQFKNPKIYLPLNMEILLIYTRKLSYGKSKLSNYPKKGMIVICGWMLWAPREPMMLL